MLATKMKEPPCKQNRVAQPAVSMLHFLWLPQKLLRLFACCMQHRTLCCQQIGNWVDAHSGLKPWKLG